MGWKILVDGQELKPDTKLDKTKTIKFTFINDTGSALDKVELIRKGSECKENNRFVFSIHTKLPAAKWAFSRRAFSETFGENNLSVFNPLPLYSIDLPDFFVILREIDPSIGEVITAFFTHQGLGFEATKLVHREILIYLIWQNKIAEAITAALAEQKDDDEGLIQFGRILQQAYADNTEEIPYTQVISFYTAIDVKYKYYKQTMQEFYQFCLSIDTSSFTVEEKRQLQAEKFRAALLSMDPAASRLYQELSGIGITSAPPEVSMQFTAIPEAIVINALIAIAEEQRKMREPLKEAGKAIIVAAPLSVVTAQNASVRVEQAPVTKWKIKVDDKELLPDAKLDKDKDYRIHLDNEDGKSAISKIVIQRWGDKNTEHADRKYGEWIYTKNTEVIYQLSKQGYREGIIGDEINFYPGFYTILNDIAFRLITLRKIEPAVGDAMAAFFTHNGIPITLPAEIKMDMLVQLIEKNKIEEAIKGALARQEEIDFSVIQFGRILERAYDDSKGAMSYQRVVEFYLGVTPKCELHSRAMQALHQFCLRVDAATLSPEQRVKLRGDQLRAALLVNDDKAWPIFYDLCVGEVAVQTMNNLKFTSAPELAVVNVFTVIAMQIRALRTAMEELQKDSVSMKDSTPSLLRLLSVVREHKHGHKATNEADVTASAAAEKK